MDTKITKGNMDPPPSAILFAVESLVPVILGSDDVLVGISGFGSARLDGARWYDAGVLTGRTSYYLSYDSQEFPWRAPPSVVELASSAPKLRRMWDEARKGAFSGASHLSKWVDRWCSSGRRVTLVGFSLGAQVAWEAARLLPDGLRGKVDIILISSAMPVVQSEWDSAHQFSSIVNVWSSSDLVLRWLYPVAAGGESAVGLGPVRSVHCRNVDLTDLIGSDHLWAGENVAKILRVVLGLEWSSKKPDGSGDILPMDALRVERLSSWLVSVPEFWEEFGRLLRGQEADLAMLSSLDRWASGERMAPLMTASSTCSRLSVGVLRQDVADRSRVQLEGLIRRWMALDRPR